MKHASSTSTPNQAPPRDEEYLRYQRVYNRLVDILRDQQHEDHWTGQLSTSALSTATAISALSLSYEAAAKSDNPPLPKLHRWLQLIQRGMAWLANAQNADGGFGDTDLSHSNIATTYLALAAHRLASRVSGANLQHLSDSNAGATIASGLSSQGVEKAESYLREKGEWAGLKARYGKDKTFVVPIMTNCALAGMVSWKHISPLPFEAAALPQAWYRFARMPVVSYAIPALVAIGQARFHFAPPRNPLTRSLRAAALQRTRRVLAAMQPDSGGYLEAVPLTSFVAMSLAAIGQVHLPVTLKALQFLEDSVLHDGSWPIDTNLATWITSLTTRVLCSTSDGSPPNPTEFAERTPPLVNTATIRWLLNCQHHRRHPFTGADPGGWGWTNLSGAVPDADDTPAAILAIDAWRRRTLKQDGTVHSNALPSNQARRPDLTDSTALADEIQAAMMTGGDWLLGLQNRDGGWPTFCRGWGQLPFDRSGSDLTAHAMRALWRIHASLPNSPRRTRRIEQAIDAGIRYLQRQQRPDGSWLPLWFGNQDNTDEENPIYGTSRVLLCLADLQHSPWQWISQQMGSQARRFLEKCQNSDGGWGGGESVDYQAIFQQKRGEVASSGTIRQSHRHHQDPNFHTWKRPSSHMDSQPEEGSGSHPKRIQSTVEETALALEALLVSDTQTLPPAFIMRGVQWLCQAVESDWTSISWPIGFYFAKLWYHERNYPFVYSLAAIGQLLARYEVRE